MIYSLTDIGSYTLDFLIFKIIFLSNLAYASF